MVVYAYAKRHVIVAATQKMIRFPQIPAVTVIMPTVRGTYPYKKAADIYENCMDSGAQNVDNILRSLGKQPMIGAAMKRGILIAAIATAALPVHAGMVISSTSPTATSLGSFAGGTTLIISVTGSVTLNGGVAGGCITTNPDGSLASSVVGIDSSDPCWSGFGGFIKENSTGYPTAFGGDGINHFVGGGLNYDDSTFGPFAPEGAPTTDTTNPLAIRLGALAGTFAASPTATDWFVVGQPLGGGLFGGSFVVPQGGGDLRVVVVDTNYSNGAGSNIGSYDITVTAVPEPSVSWLVLSGAGLLALPQVRRRLLRRS